MARDFHAPVGEFVFRGHYISSQPGGCPFEVCIIFAILIGTGRIDQHPSLPQGRPYVGENAFLPGCAKLHRLLGPLLHGLRVLAEHSLPAAGHIGNDNIEISRKAPECGRVGGSDHNIGVAPYCHIVTEDTAAVLHYLVADQQKLISEGFTKRCCKVGGLAAGRCAEVQHPDAGTPHRCKSAAENMPHEHRGRILNVVAARVEKRVQGKDGALLQDSAVRAPGNRSAFRSRQPLEGVEPDCSTRLSIHLNGQVRMQLCRPRFCRGLPLPFRPPSSLSFR